MPPTQASCRISRRLTHQAFAFIFPNSPSLFPSRSLRKITRITSYPRRGTIRSRHPFPRRLRRDAGIFFSTRHASETHWTRHKQPNQHMPNQTNKHEFKQTSKRPRVEPRTFMSFSSTSSLFFEDAPCSEHTPGDILRWKDSKSLCGEKNAKEKKMGNEIKREDTGAISSVSLNDGSLRRLPTSPANPVPRMYRVITSPAPAIDGPVIHGTGFNRT